MQDTPGTTRDDDCSVTMERIVSAAELRGNHPILGPLQASELSALSRLCAYLREKHEGLSNDLGFADADANLTGQLVGLLQTQISLAANVDLIQEAMLFVKRRDHSITLDQWMDQKVSVLLERLRLGLESATILLFVVTSPGIDRTVINADAMEAAIVLLRHHFSKNILPAMNQVTLSDAATGAAAASSIMASPKKRRRSGDPKPMKKLFKTILSTMGWTVLLFERVEVLVQKIPLDDQPLLIIASSSLQTLQLDPTQASELKFAHQCHAAAVGVLTALVRRYARLRTLILEDIFPILLKLPTYKRSMRTWPVHSSSVLFPSGVKRLSQACSGLEQTQYIQPFSALLVALVQSAVVRPVFQPPQDQDVDSQPQKPTVNSGLRECQAFTDSFVAQLLQRCSKKGEDGGASEFRPILANLIDDLLLLLLVPENPGAEMILLSLVNKISMELLAMCSASKVNAENTYLGTILDAMGKICAAEASILKFHRERSVRSRPCTVGVTNRPINQCYCSSALEDVSCIICSRCHGSYHANCIGIDQDTAPEEWFCDGCQLGRVVDFEKDRNTNLGELGCSPSVVDEPFCMRRLLVDYLSIAARKSSHLSIRDAYEFNLAQWIETLSVEPSTLQSPEGLGHMSVVQYLTEIWDPRESSQMGKSGGSSLNGMLHCLSDEGRSRMVVHLAATQVHLLTSHRSQVGLFVNQLMENRASTLLRKLALKTLEKVTDTDPKLMTYPFIRKAVTKRFSDEAISVREAAISLVGLYVVKCPEVADGFQAAFMLGLNDVGVSVRKKTIKVIQDVLDTNPSFRGRAAVCSEMLRLAADPKEDDGVRDAIHELFLEIWLSNKDYTIVEESPVPVSPSDFGQCISPSRVEDLVSVDPRMPVTPTFTPRVLPIDPDSSASKRDTRSTLRLVKRRKLQLRSEVAAEQMVEVVKAAGTGDHLATLWRDLLSSGDEKQQKTSQRKRRKVLTDGQSGMMVDALFEILLRVEESRSAKNGAKALDLVAVLRTIGVFAPISPGNVQRHMDTILPYLKADNHLSMEEESVVVTSLCNTLSSIARGLEHDDLEILDKSPLPQDLVNITYKFGRDTILSAIHALSALAHHPSSPENCQFRSRLIGLGRTFFKYLQRHKYEKELDGLSAKVKSNVHRALSILGAICRFHEGSSENIDQDEEISADSLTFDNIAGASKALFLLYLEQNSEGTKCAALRGLCGVFIANPREMLHMDQDGLIDEVMSEESSPVLQLESLSCWRDMLLTEEARVESGEAKQRMDNRENITLSKKISGDQDADATLFGSILNSHADRLFSLSQAKDRRLRFAALDLIGHLLRQGQVNPNEAVPFLLALQGDVEEEGIRSLALKLLMIEGDKRPDMLRQRVYAGIKRAFAFQKSTYPENTEVSALITMKNGTTRHTECVFGRVYTSCFANLRKQRRGLFSSLLHRFDIEIPKPVLESASFSLPVDLDLLSFTAQILAYLPYKVSSDPLFIMYGITSSLAFRGPELIDRFSTFLRPYGLSNDDALDESNNDEDLLEIAARRHVPSHAKEATVLLDEQFDIGTFKSLCFVAAAQILLLRLKSFLGTAYDLSESRVFAFSPDAKDEREKSISRASQIVFDSKLEVQGVRDGTDRSDIDHLILQYAEFRRLMRAETRGGMDMDDEGQEKRKRPLSDVEMSHVHND
eukprot:Nitzschia sp. Nitz4//scaffold222_size33694//5413//10644//NITZ4_007861-RA/size33694-augustus-gene-0.23-mRNA-1//-1//CDS//3329542588//1911//frame0